MPEKRRSRSSGFHLGALEPFDGFRRPASLRPERRMGCGGSIPGRAAICFESLRKLNLSVTAAHSLTEK
jgi:hypothetical protein